MSDHCTTTAGARRRRALVLVPLLVIGVLGVAPRVRADPPQTSPQPAPSEPAPTESASPEPGAPSPEPAPPASAAPDPGVPPPPASDTGTAVAPETPPSAPAVPEDNPYARGFVWGGTVTEVALLSSIVLEVGVLPPLDDNGPRLLLLMGASLALGAGVGTLAAVLGWPEQGTLAVSGAAWGAFALAPFGLLIDGGRSMTTDGLDTGPYTAAAALLGAAAGGVLAPLLLDVDEPAETIALHVAPGLGAFAGTIVWLALWLFGAIPDNPRTSSRALVAAAGIGGTLGLSLPFALRAWRAGDE